MFEEIEKKRSRLSRTGHWLCQDRTLIGQVESVIGLGRERQVGTGSGEGIGLEPILRVWSCVVEVEQLDLTMFTQSPVISY